MLQGNQAGQTAPAQQTELDSVLQFISSQNSRFISNIQKFEELGHRLKNTSVPMDSVKGEAQKPDGIIQEINLQLDYYQSHNNRLETILSKLQSLL